MYLNKGFQIKGCSYTGATGAAGALYEEALTATGVVNRFCIGENVFCDQVAFAISTVVASSASAVVAFQKASYPGGAATTFASLTIPSGTTTGQVVYKRFSPIQLSVGNEVVVNVTTASTSTGKGISLFSLQDDPEANANLSQMLASA